MARIGATGNDVYALDPGPSESNQHSYQYFVLSYSGIARTDGRLFIYVNGAGFGALWPALEDKLSSIFDGGGFYKNNLGTARVILNLSRAREPQTPQSPAADSEATR